VTFSRAALALLLVFALGPIVALLVRVPPAEFAAALAAPGSIDATRVTLLASFGSLALASALGIPAGYTLARGRGTLRSLALFALAIPLALPPIASGIVLLGVIGTRTPVGGWMAAHGLGAVDTLLGVGIAEFFVSGSLVAIAATAAFSDLDPALEESARTLGASPLRVFVRIALPLAAPGIGAGMLLAWLRALGEYGATSILAYHPTSLPIALATALSADGLDRALALTEAFALLTTLVLGAVAIARRGNLLAPPQA
jgi:ABC-type sulfate transport system permease component